MRLSMLPIVERTNLARNAVNSQLQALAADQFVLTIGGDRMDDALRAVVKPALQRELAGRLASLNRDLESYGVTVDSDGPVALITS